MTTYERALAGYDEEHERQLLEAIVTAIAHTSRVSDCAVMAIRTGETASALLSALAAIIALSPAARRSPMAIRKTIDEFSKRLRRRVARRSSPPVRSRLRLSNLQCGSGRYACAVKTRKAPDNTRSNSFRTHTPCSPAKRITVAARPR
jgi:hypothetical protein